MLPTVVREFAKLLKEFEICDVFDLLQANEVSLSQLCLIYSILMLPQNVILPKTTEWGGKNELDSFFPFDPYLLKNSLVFVSVSNHSGANKYATADESPAAVPNLAAPEG